MYPVNHPLPKFPCSIDLIRKDTCVCPEPNFTDLSVIFLAPSRRASRYFRIFIRETPHHPPHTPTPCIPPNLPYLATSASTASSGLLSSFRERTHLDLDGILLRGLPPGARHLSIDNDHCCQGVSHTDHPLDVPGFSKIASLNNPVRENTTSIEESDLSCIFLTVPAR